MTIIMGSVCSGIEAASVACEPLGIKTVWVSEIEPFPCAVLEHHYPNTPNLGDMNHIADLISMGIDDPDILVGGTPCQAFSVAGLREGLSDPRGMLTQTFVKIGDAIDAQRPGNECVIWWENVPGVLSSKDNAFGSFLGFLAGEDCELVPPGKKWSNAGCVLGPKRAIAWRVLDAQYFGVAQRRRRVFVVASAREGFDPAKVLFECEGVRRDSAPSREAGKAVAALTANGVGTCGADDNQGQAGHLIPEWRGFNFDQYTDGGVLSPTITATEYKGKTFVYPALTVHGSQDHDTNVELARTLGRNNGAENAVFAGGVAVRRLTPIECERLQGFPDGWTNVPIYSKEKVSFTELKERIAKLAADGPRYKAIGNSMAVPVMRWIGERIVKELSRCS